MKFILFIISVFTFSHAYAQNVDSPEAAIQQKKIEEKLIIQSVKRSYDSTNKALTKLVKKPEEKKPKQVIIYRTIYKDTCLTPQVILTMPLPVPVDSLVYEPIKKKRFFYKLFHKK